jgi:hypothetical protein
MKQWKVAISLAILGAIAAPFVTHTVRMRPTTETWIPLTQDEKERISAEMSETSNCRTLSEQFDAKKNMGTKPSVEDFMDVISRDSICRDQLKSYWAERERVSSKLISQLVRRVGDYAADMETGCPFHQEIDPAFRIRAAIIDQICGIDLMTRSTQNLDDAARTAGWLPNGLRQAFNLQ